MLSALRFLCQNAIWRQFELNFAEETLCLLFVDRFLMTCVAEMSRSYGFGAWAKKALSSFSNVSFKNFSQFSKLIVGKCQIPWFCTCFEVGLYTCFRVGLEDPEKIFLD